MACLRSVIEDADVRDSGVHWSRDAVMIRMRGTPWPVTECQCVYSRGQTASDLSHPAVGITTRVPFYVDTCTTEPTNIVLKNYLDKFTQSIKTNGGPRSQRNNHVPRNHGQGSTLILIIRFKVDISWSQQMLTPSACKTVTVESPPAEATTTYYRRMLTALGQHQEFVRQGSIRAMTVPPNQFASNGAAERVVRKVEDRLHKILPGEAQTKLSRLRMITRIRTPKPKQRHPDGTTTAEVVIRPRNASWHAGPNTRTCFRKKHWLSAAFT